MIINARPQLQNTQSFKAGSGTMSKAAFETLEHLVQSNEPKAVGLATRILGNMNSGGDSVHVKGIVAYPETGSNPIVSYLKFAKERFSITEEAVKEPQKMRDILHKYDQEAIAEIKNNVMDLDTIV